MYKLIVCIAVSLVVFSCKKESATEDVLVNITLDNLSGKTLVNRSYAITTARMYLSNFSILDSNNNAVAVKDIILINKDNSNVFSFKLPAGNYQKLRFYFGLDYATNHTADPSVFPASYPLSLSQDMFWGMLRYRFIVVEGKIDSSVAKNQTPANPFSMHLGSDTLYREITTSLPAPLSVGTTITIKADLSQLFSLDQSAFDITNFSNHSGTAEIPNAILITDNFVNAIQTSATQR